MTQPGEALHPNLARLAAAYDQIVEQMDRGELTAAQARARIAQLESRDDQGVRWSIDPDTGEFVRKTAFGELEFDDPPRFGVMTADAFAYSSAPRDDDPGLRVSLYAAPDMTPPTQLAGATQVRSDRTGPTSSRSSAATFARQLREAPRSAQLILVALLVAMLALILGLVVLPVGQTGSGTPQGTSTSTGKTAKS